jgi:putative transposase
MIAFIDDYREAHGVEPQSGSRPICKVLPIAPSTHHEHAAKGADPAKLSRPVKRYGISPLKAEIRRVCAEDSRPTARARFDRN